MKALTLRNPSLTKEILLQKADETPGAWIGIRIAGLLLILSGWKSTQVVIAGQELGQPQRIK